MKDENKTKDQLMGEMASLRQRIVELEKLESELEQRTADLSKANQELQDEIIKRQYVEENLEAERRRLFSVLDGLPAQVYLIAPDYSFRFSNRFFQERFGNPKGKPCYMVFHGRTDPCEKCLTFGVGKKIECQQDELYYPDGHTYQVYDYPFIDVDGAKLLLSFAIDITEGKQMEKALRLSEQKFSKAFQGSPDMMTISTLKEGRYIEVNDAFLEIVGYERNEVMGKTVHEVGFWEVLEERDVILKQIQEQGSIRNVEILFRTKDGGLLTTLLSADIIDMGGEPQLLCVVKDISNRKQMEREMTRLDRLHLVGEIAVSIGHEIRNPMTTVRGFLQLMRENTHLVQEGEYFDIMIEELDRANSIITEFLSLAKNKMVELKPININSLINNILPLVQASARIQNKSIQLEQEDVPELLVDEKEILQLIYNLVNNALEAMPSGGNVTIKTFMENEKVVLAVCDQGHGIDCELLDKLGTPFFTTKEQGTGLGLAVCYGIATRHKAKIDIETSSRGTTFYIRFLAT
ncbi:MAG: PAS domain S-box protein [Syntrophomonas sp.]|nr:PAS domain S-box protein [Syntrophomonas sp.]